MATIESALFEALTADPRIAVLIGDRVYPMEIPQAAALPAIAYQRISGAQVPAVGGRVNVAEATIQITITASEYRTAREIAEVIKLWFPFRGILGGLLEVLAGLVRVEVDGYGPQIEAPTIRIDLWFLHKAY